MHFLFSVRFVDPRVDLLSDGTTVYSFLSLVVRLVPEGPPCNRTMMKCEIIFLENMMRMQMRWTNMAI